MQKPKNNKKQVILAIAPCLLNQNLRARGLTQHPEIKEKILKLAGKYNAKIEQLPCPEFLFIGEREPKTYDEYIELEGFGNFCEKLAEDTLKNIKKFKTFPIIIIGIARSPSCSISYIYDKNNNLKKGEGILIHFLRKKLKAVFSEIDYHEIDDSLKKIEKNLKTIFYPVRDSPPLKQWRT